LIILGLETSTEVCSVGLLRDGSAGIEQSIRESHIHSEKVLTLVQEVIATGGIQLNQLDAIAVSIGPGSFTGLRIGLSTAKGLSFSLGKPLIAVPTFEAIAESGRQGHAGATTILVLVDAKRDEWYVGKYQVQGGTVRATGGLAVTSMAAALTGLGDDSGTVLLTDKVEAVRGLVGCSVQVDDVHPYCRGSVVAALGAIRAAAGERANASALEPMYLKDFVVRPLPASV
jgi:tRNA threonylcarbamoyladenosine biosynthesis protein TsaB